MHYCKNCLEQVQDGIAYCPNCGAHQGDQVMPPEQTLRPQEHPLFSGTEIPTTNTFKTAPAAELKSPWISAILNFFLPGLGYVYAGLGKDKAMIGFGILVFIAMVLGFYVPLLGTPSTGQTVAVPAIDQLEVLIFLFPFAFAYDGYARTSKINKEKSKKIQ